MEQFMCQTDFDALRVSRSDDGACVRSVTAKAGASKGHKRMAWGFGKSCRIQPHLERSE